MLTAPALAKLECLVFNHAVERLRKVDGRSRATEPEFRNVYNWVVQAVLHDAPFVTNAITNNLIEPACLLQRVIDRLGCSGHDATQRGAVGTTPGSDARAAVRLFVHRSLRELLGRDDVADSIERAIADAHQSGGAYREQARKVLANVRNARTGLRARLLDGTCTPAAVALASRHGLWPELWARPEMQPGYRAITLQTEQTPLEPSLLQCIACKRYAVQTREFQTRSADEPMTVFCNCTHCGKRWKM